MTFYERSELFRKYPKTPFFDHSNYQLFERIHAVLGTSNNRGLTIPFHVYILGMELQSSLFIMLCLGFSGMDCVIMNHVIKNNFTKEL